MPKADLASIGLDFALSTVLADVPETHRDEDLLLLTERALLLMRAIREQHDSWPIGQRCDVRLAFTKRLRQNELEIKTLLRRAGKLRAHTPAGLYAKAQLVSGSCTGAAMLAKSLAADMIEMPGLRRLIWPAEVV